MDNRFGGAAPEKTGRQDEKGMEGSGAEEITAKEKKATLKRFAEQRGNYQYD